MSSTQNDHKGILDGIKGLQDRVSVGMGIRTQFSTTEDAAGYQRRWGKLAEEVGIKILMLQTCDSTLAPKLPTI